MTEAIWRPNAPFRKDNKTVEEARADGLAAGLSWDRPWRPGGPHIVGVGTRPSSKQPDWVAYCKLTEDRNAAYLEGFDMGRSIAGNA